jgi:peptidoglycan/LPS O-acetylase OafA/YrhL
LVELHDKSGVGAQLLYLGVTALVGGLAMRSAVPGLGSPLLSHVGKISYGIYLLHMVVIGLVKRVFHESTFVVLAVAGPMSIGVASLVYRYFERPVLRWKESFSRV